MMKKILLIEDDLGLGFLLKRILEPKYEVMHALNALEAHAYLNEFSAPDFIITDLNLPAVPGGEFLQYLSESPLFENIPVIILSGDPEVKLIPDVKQVVAVLNKPFNPGQLLEMLAARNYQTTP